MHSSIIILTAFNILDPNLDFKEVAGQIKTIEDPENRDAEPFILSKEIRSKTGYGIVHEAGSDEAGSGASLEDAVERVFRISRMVSDIFDPRHL